MHIAVCDDDIAQRKQTERLLGREADKWIKNGDPVYTYSYGSEESLLANLMQFDAILLDLTQSGDITVKKVIEDLRNNGSASLMVVCHEGLTEDPELPEDTLFLPKPIKTEELHKMMELVKASEGGHTPLIELRGEHETLYVKEEEIIRAEQDGRYEEQYHICHKSACVYFHIGIANPGCLSGSDPQRQKAAEKEDKNGG